MKTKPAITKIITVCTGNICRSPIAEGLLRHFITTPKIQIDSAATHAYHIGAPPDKRAIAIMKQHGHNIAQQKARLLQKDDLKSANTLILVASDEHQRHAEHLKQQSQGNAQILKLLSHHPEHQNENLPDPYYGTTSDFEHVYQLLYTALPLLLKEIL